MFIDDGVSTLDLRSLKAISDSPKSRILFEKLNSTYLPRQANCFNVPAKDPARKKKQTILDFTSDETAGGNANETSGGTIEKLATGDAAREDLVHTATAALVVPTIEELVDMNEGEDEDIPSQDLCDNQEFFIPIHDFVRFTDDELQVIDHPAFQRLGKIYQLGQSHLVYRGATHKRLEHCLGTVRVAQRIVNAVRATYRSDKSKYSASETRCAFAEPPTLLEIRFIRLAALLHDIGHLPAGHTLEDELCILAPHDAEARLNLIFDKRDWIRGLTSERLGAVINDRYNRYLGKDATKTASDVVKLIISKDAGDIGTTNNIRVSVCRDIVGNTICADLLDYLHRDWYHIGKPKFFEKRLFQYMQIRKDARDESPKFVVSYGDKNRPKRDGVSAILKLLESRYDLAEAVLFHPTKCSAAAMLERGISELYNVLKPEEQQPWVQALESRFLSYSDDELLSAFLEEAIERNCQSGVAVLQSLIRRDIYKSVCLIMKDAAGPGCYDLLMHRFLGIAETKRPRIRSLDEKRRAAQTRRGAIARFEQEFELPAGSVVMYCPPPNMNSKLAEVKIIKDGAIRTLEEWDTNPFRLAGGHCNAQMARFENLWRVEVFVEKKVKTEIADLMQPHFEQAVRLLLLGITDDGAQPDNAVLELAKHLSTVPGKFYGRKVSELVAAKGSPTRYPMGAPLLKSFFQ